MNAEIFTLKPRAGRSPIGLRGSCMALALTRRHCHGLGFHRESRSFSHRHAWKPCDSDRSDWHRAICQKYGLEIGRQLFGPEMIYRLPSFLGFNLNLFAALLLPLMVAQLFQTRAFAGGDHGRFQSQFRSMRSWGSGYLAGHRPLELGNTTTRLMEKWRGLLLGSDTRFVQVPARSGKSSGGVGQERPFIHHEDHEAHEEIRNNQFISNRLYCFHHGTETAMTRLWGRPEMRNRGDRRDRREAPVNPRPPSNLKNHKESLSTDVAKHLFKSAKADRSFLNPGHYGFPAPSLTLISSPSFFRGFRVFRGSKSGLLSSETQLGKAFEWVQQRTGIGSVFLRKGTTEYTEHTETGTRFFHAPETRVVGVWGRPEMKNRGDRRDRREVSVNLRPLSLKNRKAEFLSNLLSAFSASSAVKNAWVSLQENHPGIVRLTDVPKNLFKLAKIRRSFLNPGRYGFPVPFISLNSSPSFFRVFRGSTSGLLSSATQLGERFAWIRSRTGNGSVFLRKGTTEYTEHTETGTHSFHAPETRVVGVWGRPEMKNRGDRRERREVSVNLRPPSLKNRKADLFSNLLSASSASSAVKNAWVSNQENHPGTVRLTDVPKNLFNSTKIDQSFLNPSRYGFPALSLSLNSSVSFFRGFRVFRGSNSGFLSWKTQVREEFKWFLPRTGIGSVFLRNATTEYAERTETGNRFFHAPESVVAGVWGRPEMRNRGDRRDRREVSETLRLSSIFKIHKENISTDVFSAYSASSAVKNAWVSNQENHPGTVRLTDVTNNLFKLAKTDRSFLNPGRYGFPVPFISLNSSPSFFRVFRGSTSGLLSSATQLGERFAWIRSRTGNGSVFLRNGTTEYTEHTETGNRFFHAPESTVVGVLGRPEMRNRGDRRKVPVNFRPLSSSNRKSELLSNLLSAFSASSAVKNAWVSNQGNHPGTVRLTDVSKNLFKSQKTDRFSFKPGSYGFPEPFFFLNSFPSFFREFRVFRGSNSGLLSWKTSVGERLAWIRPRTGIGRVFLRNGTTEYTERTETGNRFFHAPESVFAGVWGRPEMRNRRDRRDRREVPVNFRPLSSSNRKSEWLSNLLSAFSASSAVKNAWVSNQENHPGIVRRMDVTKNLFKSAKTARSFLNFVRYGDPAPSVSRSSSPSFFRVFSVYRGSNSGLPSWKTQVREGFKWFLQRTGIGSVFLRKGTTEHKETRLGFSHDSDTAVVRVSGQSGIGDRRGAWGRSRPYPSNIGKEIGVGDGFPGFYRSWLFSRGTHSSLSSVSDSPTGAPESADKVFTFLYTHRDHHPAVNHSGKVPSADGSAAANMTLVRLPAGKQTDPPPIPNQDRVAQMVRDQVEAQADPRKMVDRLDHEDMRQLCERLMLHLDHRLSLETERRGCWS